MASGPPAFHSRAQLGVSARPPTQGAASAARVCFWQHLRRHNSFRRGVETCCLYVVCMVCHRGCECAFRALRRGFPVCGYFVVPFWSVLFFWCMSLHVSWSFLSALCVSRLSICGRLCAWKDDGIRILSDSLVCCSFDDSENVHAVVVRGARILSVICRRAPVLFSSLVLCCSAWQCRYTLALVGSSSAFCRSVCG